MSDCPNCDSLAAEAAEMAVVLRRVSLDAPHALTCSTRSDPHALCDCYLPGAPRLACTCSAAVRRRMTAILGEEVL